MSLAGLEPWTRVALAPRAHRMRLLGLALQRWRERTGRSAAHLALLVGVDRRAIHTWESGAHPRYLATLEVLGFRRPRASLPERGRRDRVGTLGGRGRRVLGTGGAA